MRTDEVTDIYTMRDYINANKSWRKEIGGIIKRLGFIDMGEIGYWVCEDNAKNRLYLDSNGFAQIM